jgi:hypothetical protein
LVDGIEPEVLMYSTKEKTNLRIPSSKNADEDAFSSVYTSARTILTKLGNIDIRTLSFGSCPKYNAFINWNALLAARELW